ncbi:hypothetical protein EDB19DRAFT_1827731 [Suillus lakei]|nr:hypothetical protein EDB19DRAFT_1827731 [Suillus lakei]
MDIVEAPVFALDTESPSVSGSSHMEHDFIHQPPPDIPRHPDNGINPHHLSGSEHMEGYNFGPEPFLSFDDSFLPELDMTSSMDYVPSQTWNSYTLPQSSDESSSDGGLPCDYARANKHAHNHHDEPLSHNIQPCPQNSSNVYLSGLCGRADLPSPTPSWSEERGSECSSLMDDLDSPLSSCRWGGGFCSSLLTFDKSEVAKHLQIHGVKSGGDKEKMLCNWDGCRKEMKKESISRHIVAVHLSSKTKCARLWKAICSVGFQAAPPEEFKTRRTPSPVVAMIFRQTFQSIMHIRYRRPRPPSMHIMSISRTPEGELPTPSKSPSVPLTSDDVDSSASTSNHPLPPEISPPSLDPKPHESAPSKKPEPLVVSEEPADDELSDLSEADEESQPPKSKSKKGRTHKAI